MSEWPNTYQDNLRVGSFSELPDSALHTRVDEYGNFCRRQGISGRAKEVGNRVLDHLLFELAWRDGIYDEEDCER